VRLGAYKRQFVEFLAGIAGGPQCYSGDDLLTAHRGLGVTCTDFDRFFVYFVQSLHAVDIPAPARSELLSLFVLTKEEVVERW
jgi:hemoglobin